MNWKEKLKALTVDVGNALDPDDGLLEGFAGRVTETAIIVGLVLTSVLTWCVLSLIGCTTLMATERAKTPVAIVLGGAFLLMCALLVLVLGWWALVIPVLTNAGSAVYEFGMREAKAGADKEERDGA